MKLRCKGCGQWTNSVHDDCVAQPDTCTVEACDDDTDARGYCPMHYKRWSKHGDPTYVTPRDEYAERSDATSCPSFTRYHDGCRCLDCRVMWADYQVKWKAGELEPRPTVAEAQQMLRDLLSVGLDRDAIVADTGMSQRTFYRWVNGQGEHAVRRVFGRLEDLHSLIGGTHRRLDATPLLGALEARADNGIRPLLGPDTRTYYRAKRRGWVTEEWADRIACTVLGMPLPLLYGTDYDQEAA